MIKLHACDQCSSFLPAGITECPNCASPIAARLRRIARPLVALGGGVLAMTLTACYGGGVESYDSGPDRDTGSMEDTGAADTGTEDAATDASSDDAATDASGDDAATDASGDDAAADASGDAAP